jgi:DNA-binding NtrC family response regulator
MHPRLQAKLLRAIQEREVDRVGGTQPIKVDIRLLATSNRDLDEEVREGRFREDLYFRLNVMTLEMPPLRARPGDIPALAEHFIRKYAEANGLPTPKLSDEALGMLRSHQWRGNVRELENTMHRAVLLSQGPTLGPDAILLTGGRGIPVDAGRGNAAAPASAASAEAGTAPLVGRTVADVERDLIIETLSHCLGNRTHAATILGISIRTLRNKLKQYGGEGMSIPGRSEADRVTV